MWILISFICGITGNNLVAYLSLFCLKLLQTQNCLIQGCRVLLAVFHSSILKFKKFLFSFINSWAWVHADVTAEPEEIDGWREMVPVKFVLLCLLEGSQGCPSLRQRRPVDGFGGWDGLSSTPVGMSPGLWHRNGPGPGTAVAVAQELLQSQVLGFMELDQSRGVTLANSSPCAAFLANFCRRLSKIHS